MVKCYTENILKVLLPIYAALIVHPSIHPCLPSFPQILSSLPLSTPSQELSQLLEVSDSPLLLHALSFYSHTSLKISALFHAISPFCLSCSAFFYYPDSASQKLVSTGSFFFFLSEQGSGKCDNTVFFFLISLSAIDDSNSTSRK